MDFRGRHVVVTGGTGALGIAVTGALLEAGAVCHVPYRSEDEAQRFPHRGLLERARRQHPAERLHRADADLDWRAAAPRARHAPQRLRVPRDGRRVLQGDRALLTGRWQLPAENRQIATCQ